MIRDINPLDYIDRIEPLIAANWSETGFDFPLALNRTLYGELYSRGLLHCLGAFDCEELVGYATAVISPHLFNPDVHVFTCDALYVHPDFRHSMLSGRLITEVELKGMRLGATHMHWLTRAGTPLAATFMRHGYEPADVSVIRRI